MQGDVGNDVYTVDDAGDLVVEVTGEGNDRVLSSISFNASGLSIERISAANAAGTDALNFTGGDDTVQIDGNAGNNELYAFASDSAATLNGRSGDDFLYGSSFNDILSGGNGQDALAGGSGDDVAIGGSGDDVLIVFGSLQDYVIEQLDTDSYSVEGPIMGSGTDTTFGVEYIYFAADDEYYLLSDIGAGPVANPGYTFVLAAPVVGGDKDSDAQVLPTLADEGIETASVSSLFAETGNVMLTDDAFGSGLPAFGGFGHDDYWLF